MENNGFSILMLCFGALLFIVARLIAHGNWQLISHIQASNVRDKHSYARHLGNAMTPLAGAPLLGGAVGLLSGSAAAVAIITFVGLIAGIALCARQMRTSPDDGGAQKGKRVK